MQAARDLVGVLVEFSAGMELGHDDLGGGYAFALVDVGRNAAAVVADGAGTVGIEANEDFLGVAGERLVDGVIDDLVDHVMQAGAVIGVADIHARPLAHGIEPLEHLDRFRVVIGGCGGLVYGRVRPCGKLSNRRQKCTGESANLVHENGIAYTAKRPLLRYCHIVVFQGCGGRRIGPRFGLRTAASVNVFAGRQIEVAPDRASELRPPRARLEQMLVTGPVVGDRMLERAEGGSPKFHAIQILAQPLEGFDQVPHNQIFCRFRHCYSPLSLSGHFLLLEVKRLRAVLFRPSPESPPKQILAMIWNRSRRKSLGLPHFGAQPPGTDLDHLGIAVDLHEKRRIGAGHPHLAAELRKFRMQSWRAAPDRDARQSRRATGSARCRSSPQSIGREPARAQSTAPFVRRSTCRPPGCLYPRRGP